MLLEAMAESRVKAMEVLESRVERLLTGSSTTLELSDSRSISRIGITNYSFLSTVPFVTNGPLAGRNLVLEAFAEDGNVVLPSREVTINIDHLIRIDIERNFIIETSLFELVGVVFGIL